MRNRGRSEVGLRTRYRYVFSAVMTHVSQPVHQNSSQLRKFFGKLSATPFQPQSSRTIPVVAGQISTSYLCSAVYSLLVYSCNPSRPCLTPECRFHLNQTRSLSYSYISPSQTCLPCMSRFNPAPQTADFLPPGFLQAYTYYKERTCIFVSFLLIHLPMPCESELLFNNAQISEKLLNTSKYLVLAHSLAYDQSAHGGLVYLYRGRPASTAINHSLRFVWWRVDIADEVTGPTEERAGRAALLYLYTTYILLYTWCDL